VQLIVSKAEKHEVEVDSLMSVKEFGAFVSEETGIPLAELRLAYNGKPIDTRNKKPLASLKLKGKVKLVGANMVVVGAKVAVLRKPLAKKSSSTKEAASATPTAPATAASVAPPAQRIDFAQILDEDRLAQKEAAIRIAALGSASATSAAHTPPPSPPQQDQQQPADAAAAALEAKRAAIIAAVVAAKKGQAAAAAVSAASQPKPKARQATFEDLFGDCGVTQQVKAEFNKEDQKVKGYRMQAEYGAKMYIKP
jgi:hypothetical protein